MTRLACSESDWVRCEPWEIEQPAWMRTALVLREYKRRYDEEWVQRRGRAPVRIFLICGADLVLSFLEPGVWLPEDVRGGGTRREGGGMS